MSYVREKSIYVLGAGASMHAGPPLLKDFLRRSHELYWAPKPGNSSLGIRYPESFDRLFKWLSEANLGLEILNGDNLEDVFSIVELGYEAGVPEFVELRKAVTEVLFDTLALTARFENSQADGYHDPLYAGLIAHLKSFEKIRKTRISSERFRRDSIISFNYDLLLDASFGSANLPINYGLGDNPKGSYDVFKLHGSMNWLHHPSCKEQSDDRISVVPYSEFQKYLMPVQDKRYQLNHLQMLVNLGRCKVCNTHGDTLASFVPPTWAKSPLRGNISKVWAAAISSMQDAEQIVVIGYSLPETDTFFKYMLTLGLSNAKQLRRVVVVDPDKSGDIDRKYRAVFTRKKIEVRVLNLTFKQFIQGMDSVSVVSEY